MRSILWRAIAAASALMWLCGVSRPTAAPALAAADVDAVLASLSPAARVGQLFIVPVDGAEVTDGSAIAALIDDAHVGGVVLDAGRGNFTNTPDAPAQVARLANALQSRRAGGRAPFVPMLVALSQAGNELPDSSLVGGMTVTPSQMAIGATWQSERAEAVGEAVGRELAAVGVTFLLGPDLDVTAAPLPGTSGDLGTRVFGGSPPWVARLGQSYVRGVAQGSGGRVATAAASFPGVGAADRNPAEEGAVVERGLQELVAIDLVPFAAVSGGEGTPSTAAMVSSHVRYRAIQQQVDRPFSLDSGGMRYLFAQVPQLGRWREAGGVVVSAGLGLPTVRRYVDPTLTDFNARRVVGEALSAGNDLLLVTDFGPPDDPANGQANIEAAIEWLVERYGQDPAVREAVDAAARRVLAMKLAQHGSFELNGVLVDAERASGETGLATDLVAEVAATALTLIAPGGAPAAGTIAAAPQRGDSVLFVVDERPIADCPTCEARSAPSAGDLVERTRRRYGPAGLGRLGSDDDVQGMTFADLKGWLQVVAAPAVSDSPALVPALTAERLAEVDQLVRRADWMIFAMRDVRTAGAPASDAVKLFLRSSLAESGGRRLMALAFAAPYFLDTTEIAKLGAYYALYSRSEPFADLAVRAVFGDAPATGASPVSVSGAGYDLARRLEPALGQVVQLEVVGRDAAHDPSVGDDLTIRSGVVLDGNGRPAPDGTHVTFRLYAGAEGVFLPDVPSAVRDGRVTELIRADRAGDVTIEAVFDNGLRSAPLELRVQDRGAAAAILDEMAIADRLLAPTVTLSWSILLLSLTLILMAAVIGHGAATAERTPGARGRTMLLCLAWGLAGYLLVAAGGLPPGRSPSSLPFWPSSWPDAYLAPVLSFVLAMVPVIPAIIRDVHGWMDRQVER